MLRLQASSGQENRVVHNWKLFVMSEGSLEHWSLIPITLRLLGMLMK